MKSKKKDDETELQYIWRIGQMYDNNLLDMTWLEIGDLFNSELKVDDDKCLTESAYRKKYQAAVKYYDEVFKHMLNNKEYIDDIDMKKYELQKERYKISATKLELNRHFKHESRFELFYDNIKEAIIKLNPVELIPYSSDKVYSKNKFVLSIADIHYGANFKSENNEYSREICKQRFGILLSETIIDLKKNEINELIVINLSDSIQGMLRYTDLQINDIPVVDAVVEIARIIAEFLNQLSKYCNIEYRHVSAANHSQTRNLGSKASELATEDMERIIINYIHDVLVDNDRVTVYKELDVEYSKFDIFNYKVIAYHGHQIKDVKNSIKNASMLHRTFYDYIFLGHRHSANEIIVAEGKTHNIEVLTCPSFIGSDPYSDSLMVGSKAMCKLYEFSEEHGHIGSKYIMLQK